MKTTPAEDRRAAIVCSHVALGLHPILRAVRDEPTMLEDSGWQFNCGVEDEDESTAKVWLVCEVLEDEPSLAEFMGYPPLTVLTRPDVESPWTVGGKAAETGTK